MRNAAKAAAALPNHPVRASGGMPVGESMEKSFADIRFPYQGIGFCEKLRPSAFDGGAAKDRVHAIWVQSDGSLQIKLPCTEYFKTLPN